MDENGPKLMRGASPSRETSAARQDRGSNSAEFCRDDGGRSGSQSAASGQGIAVPAAERKLKRVQAVDSASARYQQCVQSMSEFHDLVQALSSSHLAWVSLIVDSQKSTLDLYRTTLAASAHSSVVPRLTDASAKYVLQAAQGWWFD
jgi:hypothetical protein